MEEWGTIITTTVLLPFFHSLLTKGRVREVRTSNLQNLKQTRSDCQDQTPPPEYQASIGRTVRVSGLCFPSVAFMRVLSTQTPDPTSLQSVRKPPKRFNEGLGHGTIGA